MAISKKKLSEVLQTAYSSIPLATSNNNGLLDKNIYSKACYMNQSPACIARVCDGGLVGILSIFKDHEDYHDIFMVHCYKKAGAGNVEVTRLSANTTGIKKNVNYQIISFVTLATKNDIRIHSSLYGQTDRRESTI